MKTLIHILALSLCFGCNLWNPVEQQSTQNTSPHANENPDMPIDALDHPTLAANSIQDVEAYIREARTSRSSKLVERLRNGDLSALTHPISRPVRLNKGLIIVPKDHDNDFQRFLNEKKPDHYSDEQHLLQALVQFGYYDPDSPAHRALVERNIPTNNNSCGVQKSQNSDQGPCDECIVSCFLIAEDPLVPELPEPSASTTNSCDGSGTYAKARKGYLAITCAMKHPVFRGPSGPGTGEASWGCQQSVESKTRCFFIPQSTGACANAQVEVYGKGRAFTNLRSTAYGDGIPYWGDQNSDGLATAEVQVPSFAVSGNKDIAHFDTALAKAQRDDLCDYDINSVGQINCSLDFGLAANLNVQFPGCSMNLGLHCQIDKTWFAPVQKRALYNGSYFTGNPRLDNDEKRLFEPQSDKIWHDQLNDPTMVTVTLKANVHGERASWWGSSNARTTYNRSTAAGHAEAQFGIYKVEKVDPPEGIHANVRVIDNGEASFKLQCGAFERDAAENENTKPNSYNYEFDAPQCDAGPPDAGPPDAGPPDAGPPDAGPPDAGPTDAGTPPPTDPQDAGSSTGGCTTVADCGGEIQNHTCHEINDAYPMSSMYNLTYERWECPEETDPSFIRYCVPYTETCTGLEECNEATRCE